MASISPEFDPCGTDFPGWARGAGKVIFHSPIFPPKISEEHFETVEQACGAPIPSCYMLPQLECDPFAAAPIHFVVHTIAKRPFEQLTENLAVLTKYLPTNLTHESLSSVHLYLIAFWSRYAGPSLAPPLAKIYTSQLLENRHLPHFEEGCISLLVSRNFLDTNLWELVRDLDIYKPPETIKWVLD
eukprot:TRINITY_DN6494_c0_g2_i1.p1 TRINITY_DN6494_c0_g2~~TRINITY_DN6494_c0_g2_i1.p1  ORF type:complete len:205 (+),score=7.42 TRINITY_DN6494_c0_g2_i1:58-615(+)